jgi:hypothetical protein
MIYTVILEGETVVMLTLHVRSERDNTRFFGR